MVSFNYTSIKLGGNESKEKNQRIKKTHMFGRIRATLVHNCDLQEWKVGQELSPATLHAAF